MRSRAPGRGARCRARLAGRRPVCEGRGGLTAFGSAVSHWRLLQALAPMPRSVTQRPRGSARVQLTERTVPDRLHGPRQAPAGCMWRSSGAPSLLRGRVRTSARGTVLRRTERKTVSCPEPPSVLCPFSPSRSPGPAEPQASGGRVSLQHEGQPPDSEPATSRCGGGGRRGGRRSAPKE